METTKQHIMNYKLILMPFVMVLGLLTLQANNVTISNTTYDGNETITFDLSWENSWRTSITQPYNYDGVWIFVKVRECTQKNLGSPSGFTHAWLSTSSGDHSATNSAPDGEALTIELGNTDISSTSRGMGIFVYQTADVTEATNISTTVTLRWDKTTQAGQMSEIDVADNYDVQVFGIEMVYVPQGDYYVGDASSSNCFQDASSNPYQITSEAALTASGTYNRQIDATSGNINANFPKGWDSFWMMKYEITQLEYAEFLNTLTPIQADARTTVDLFTLTARRYIMSNNAGITNRQAIILDPEGDTRTDRFYVNMDNDYNYNENEDGLGVACNYLNLRDVLAYMDWAALRPLTEMEYEKASRGSIYPQLNEYSWGSVGLTAITGIVNSGQPNEGAIASGVGLCSYGGTSVGSSGPMRVGFAATSTTNRAEAGCSYYGIMDLTGNIFEPYVSFYSSTAVSDLFENISGDGELQSDGYHNVAEWPSNASDADYATFLAKGGSWAHSSGYARTSRRADVSFYDNDTYVNSRNQYYGGRGGR